MARPSIYTPEIIEELCAGLADGIPLAQLCRQEGMPAYITVWTWMRDMPEVNKAIACAREAGEDVIATNTRLTARGIGESTHDVQRDKLIIDTDLKLLAKWNPKKYGDKLALGGDGSGEPIKMDNTVRVILVEPDGC